MDAVLKAVKSMLKHGATLREALSELNISYSRWRAICAKEGVIIATPRGKRASVYTKERVTEVKKRVRKGEYLKDVTHDMGMDPKNLARYCRNNGIKLFSKRALKDNYKRRGKARKTSEKALEIQARVQAGLKDAEIAGEVGVTRQYVYYVRKKMARGA